MSLLWLLLGVAVWLAGLYLNALFMVLIGAAAMWVVEKIREWWIRRP